jgi:hypothetical protein
MWRRLALLLLAIAATGCGAANSTTEATTPAGSPTPAAPGNGLAFVITVHLTGARAVDTTLHDTVKASNSCADWAQHGLAGVMTPPGAGGSSSVGYAALVTPYHGPGLYTDTADLLALNAAGRSFTAVQGTSSLRITVDADGSGEMRITAFQDIADSSKQESGTISWRCSPAP